MLTLEAPFYVVKNIIVFRDHASPSTFYYLAGPPELSRRPDGKLDFMLLKYREALDAAGAAASRVREQLGGAFLIFGVDCALSSNLLEEIKGEVSSQVPDGAGEIQLLPVLYTHGTVKVVALDYQPATGTGTGADAAKPSRFVRGVIGTATPSLLQDQRAIFSVSLDPDAATLLEAAYDDDLSPIGVMYELEFQALRPALSVHATVDYKRAYEMFKTRLTVGVHTNSGNASTNDQGSRNTPGPAGAGAAGGAGAGGAGAGGAGGGVQPQVPNPPDIVIAITTGGALGTMEFTTQVGSGAASAPVRSGAAAPFNYQVPSTSTTLVFPAGPYPVGNYLLHFTSPTVGQVTPQGAPATGRPTIAQRTTAQTVTSAGGAGSNPAGAGSAGGGTTTPPTTTTTTKSTSDQSTTQFGLDMDIQYAMEKLKQEEAIKIEIVRQMDGKSVDDMEKEAMDLLKEEILKDFFKPALSTSVPPQQAAASSMVNNAAATTANINRPMAGNSAATPTGTGNTSSTGTTSASTSATRVDIGFQLQYKTEDELKTATYDFSAQSVETRIHAPSGFFSLLLSGTKREELIKSIDLDDPFFKVIDAQVSTIADFATLDLKSVVVDVAYGGTDDAPKVRQTYNLTPADAAAKNFQAFVDGDDMAWRSAVRYSFGESELVAAQTAEYQMPWRSSTSRAVVVVPEDDVPMLHLYVEQGVIDWDLVARIETTITYDDPANGFHAERTFLVGSDFKRQEWTIRLTDPNVRAYTVQHTWFLKDDGRRIQGAPYQATAAQVFVFDPFVDRIPIVVQALVDPTSVTRVTVAFSYKDTAHQIDVHKLVELDGPAFKPVTLTLPLMDPKKREYTYTATIVKANGEAVVRKETTTSDLALNIGDGSVIVDVQVTLLGDVAAAKASAVQVDLQAEPIDGRPPTIQSHLFEAGGDKKWTQRLLLRSDRPDRTYQYRTTIFLNDKGPVSSDWIDAETSVLPLQVSRLASP